MKPLASLGFAAAFLLAGCSTAEFYWQGITGQIDLLVRAQSIPSVLEKIGDPIVKRQLERELAHQLIYAKDDTVFNESYAVTVEEEGLRRWLASQHDPDLDRQFETGERYRATFRALVERTRARLEKLYGSDSSDEAKRAGKA